MGFWSHAPCSGTFQRVTSTGVMRIGLPYNKIPQGFVDKQGNWVGFEVDFAQELARRLNLELEKVKVNDKTWGPLLSSGRIDAALCRIRHNRSLEGDFDFSSPYFFDSLRIMVRKGAAKSVKDLKQAKVAAIQGSVPEKVAMKILRDLGDENAEKNVVSYPDRPSCFIALGKEKVSGWLDSGLVLLEYSSRSPNRFELLEVGSGQQAIAAALPENDSSWRDLINFTIQDMIADGSVGRLLKKWFSKDGPYPFTFNASFDIWPE
jgi:polar amino acid transport system substrate-binding protein